MKQCLLMILLTLLAATLVFAGGQDEATTDSSPSDGESVIEYWYPWGGDSEDWDLWRIAEYEAAHPGYTVNSTYVPTDGGLESGKLLTAIVSGTPPDLVVTGSTPAGYALKYQNALTDMEPYLAEEGLTVDDFNVGASDIMADGMYAIPMDSNVIMLFYNKTMLEEAGLDPDQPPRTVEELDEYAAALDTFDGDRIVTMGFIPWLDVGSDAFAWPWVFGSEVTDPVANTINITDQGMLDYMAWIRDYAERYDPETVTAFASGFGALFSPDHPFMRGQVAMTTIGNWMHNAIKQYAPDLDYGVTTLPPPAGGRDKATTLFTNLYLVPTGAPNPQGAAHFIANNYATEIILDNVETWYSVPALETAWEEIPYIQNNNPKYLVVQELATSPNAAHVGLSSVSSELSNDLISLRDQVIFSGVDPLPLLEALETRLQEKIERGR